ncbi:DUF262 domain-containing protein [Cellulosimicrobium cellulans]|uniref:DUF262 domain-containing protein n=1 Tax=Cellulosimicrobium cellulans TaxID=1710 RepID=UPI002096E4A8|nr:DUF262 domain-containing protein [Cellulosimicrobium cellulans]MCO7272098.1 DUF262 domain-containing protein [Cellulosimicrobium cellulans]
MALQDERSRLTLAADGTEPEDEGVTIDRPFDPATIDVITRTPTVDLLLKRLRNGALDLTPDFQRHAGVWSEADQSRLIESLLLRIPLPTLYAAESGDDGWVVVDGIQRLTTIARFVNPKLVAESYGSSTPLRLRDLEYLKAYEGKTYEQLPGSLQTRIDETELLVHLIRSGTPEEVKFNIFARINTGGRPLTPQELRHALVPGPARSLLAKLAESKEFRVATGNSIRSSRMADREMALRFLAFRITDPNEYPRGDLDRFLVEAMHRINRLTPKDHDRLTAEFRQSMIDAYAIFGKFAFRKRDLENLRYLVPVNKALFETVSVSLAGLGKQRVKVLVDRRKLVEERFLDLLRHDARFVSAISVGTGDVEKVRLRFRTFRALLEGVSA